MITLPITQEQANYLNTVARIAYKYTVNNERIRQDLAQAMDRVNKGFTPSPIRHQDAADIAREAGQLDALESILYTVFPFPVHPHDAETPEAMDAAKEHEAKVAGYFRTAMTLGDGYIFMEH